MVKVRGWVGGGAGLDTHGLVLIQGYSMTCSNTLELHILCCFGLVRVAVTSQNVPKLSLFAVNFCVCILAVHCVK